MEFSKFIEWAFYALLSGGVVWVCRYLQLISKDITKLHADLSVIVERTAWHDRAINDHSGRIRELEVRKRL